MKTLFFEFKSKAALLFIKFPVLFLTAFLTLMFGCNQKAQIENLFEQASKSLFSETLTKLNNEIISPPNRGAIPGSEPEVDPDSDLNSNPDLDSDSEDQDPDLGLWPVQAPEPTLLNPPNEVNAEFKSEIYLSVTKPVATWVDKLYTQHRQLLEKRSLTGSHSSDVCFGKEQVYVDFAYAIGSAIHEKMRLSKAQLTYVAGYFDLPTNIEKYNPNSLWSHPLCNVTKDTLKQTFQGSRIPSADIISKINQFADKYNSLRKRALSGEADAYWGIEQLWSRLMMCLSYTESLTTADSQKSDKVARNYAPKGYHRPDGVLFYEDPYQTPESRLNIGLYQFTPSAGGNIKSCIRSWNELHSNCKINEETKSSEMLKILGSNWQRFNAFCGVSKVTDMFSVQINTKGKNHTHPYNRIQSNNLRPSGERCVSLHMNTNTSYNHFGPFQNSANSLKMLMNCTMGKSK